MVTAQNTGTSAISLGSVAIAGANPGDFAIASNTCGASVAGSATCAIGITFTPNAAGSRSATLVFTDSASNSPQTVSLSGTGSAAGAVSVAPTSLIFAATTVGTAAAAQSVTLSNGGTSAISISSVGLSGADPGDFAIASNTCGTSLAGAAACTIGITFNPTTTGSRTAILTFTDSAGNSPQTVTVSGIGSAAGSVTLAPASLIFAATTVGTSTTAQSATLSNGGASAVSISSVALSGADPGDFAISANSCSTSLAASATCTIAVMFKPTVTGSRTATLTVTDSAGNSPQSVALSGTGSAANATVAPSSLTFASTTLGSTTAAQSVTLTNGSTSAIAISNVALSGTNPGDFAIASNTCGTSLAGSATCTVAITFKPTATGSRAATLAFTDAAGNSPQAVALSGTGTAATVTLAPSSLTFASTTLGSTTAAQSVTLTNGGTSAISISSVALSGTNSGDFAISANTCGTSLAGSASCTVSITFKPTAAGSRTATLKFTDAAGNSPQTVTLSGTGSAANATVAPTSLTFASTTLGSTTAAQSVTLTNGGTSAIAISSVALSGANPGDFAISANSCGTTLAGSASCTVSITFKPAATGSRAATLTFTDAAGNSPQTVALSGIGAAANATVAPTNLTFASTILGTTTAAQSVTLTNGGPIAIAITSVGLSGTNPGDFTMSANTCGTSLAGSASCTVSITFKPTATGSRMANLTFTDGAGNSPQTVALSGIGAAANATVAPTSLTFASTIIGTTTAAQSVTLTNGGTSAIAISSVALSGTNPGDFAIAANTCGTSLAGSASCTVSITFTPTATGSRAATLTFTDGAGNSPQTVALSGTGTAANATVSPASLIFAATTVGTTRTAQTVTLTNGGTSAITISGVALSGTNPGDFAIASNTCGGSLAGSATCTVGITFTPTAAGSRTATLNFTDGAGNSPQTVALSGTGSLLNATLAPSSLTFSATAAGTTSAPQSLTLTNTGASAITITSLAFSGANPGDFAIASNTCGASLAASSSCTVGIDFTPSGLGTRTATITFVDSAGNSPQSAALSGSGIASSATLTPTNLNFPATAVAATSAAQSVTLTNNGPVALTINSVTVGGTNAADFAISSNTCGTSLAGSGSCTVSITFTPTATGRRTGTVTIRDAASNTPQVVGLAGTGGTSPVLVSPTSLTYPPTDEGHTTAGQVAILTNTGATAVAISSINITGSGSASFFIINNTCGTSLAANSSCSVAVEFKPNALGSLIATLNFNDAAVGSPQTVSLFGTGGTSAFSIQPTNPTVAVNDTLQFTATAPVTWAATCGTIGATSGFYNAPSSTGKCTVTATDGATPPASVSTTVTVTNGPATGTLAVYPDSAAVVAGAEQIFQAQLSGIPDTHTLTYSIDGVSGGNATTGTITNQGVYTAPFAAGYHLLTVTDTSLGTSATANIIVFSAVNVDFGSRAANANPVPAGLFAAERPESLRTAADLDLLTAGGITYGRSYAQIPTVFQTSTPNWTAIDSLIQRVTASGVTHMMLQMYQTPPWLQPANDGCGTNDLYSLPTDLNAWGSIAAQYVKHMDATFPGVVTDYEIWNEPNTASLCVDPSVSLSDYMALYKAAATQMKAQAQADGSTIHIGGPATAGLQGSWISAMLSDPVIAQNIDFVSYHQYLLGPTQLGAQWDTYNGTNSVYQMTQDNSQGPAQNYEYAGYLVSQGSQPQGASLPIDITEYNLNWQFQKDCCRNDFTYGPLWNALWVADLLNVPLAYTGAPNSLHSMVYYSATTPPYFCLLGVYDANMDCSYPNGTPAQPYPQYFTYQLFGASKYLGLQGGGYMAQSISPQTLGNGLVVTAFFTPSIDAVVLINPSQYTYTDLPINVANTGLSSAQATVYQIVGGRAIQSSSGSLQSQGGTSYSTTITIGPYSVQAISIHP